MVTCRQVFQLNDQNPMTVANRTLMNSISWSTLSDILANLDGSGPIILINCGTSLCAMVQNLFMAFIVLIKKRQIFMNTTPKSWTIFLLQKNFIFPKTVQLFGTCLYRKTCSSFGLPCQNCKMAMANSVHTSSKT